MVSLALSATLNAAEEEVALERRRTFVAAYTARGFPEMGPTGATAFARALNLLGDKTDKNTVGAWLNGPTRLSVVQLRGLLTILGFPPTWRPGDPVPPLPKGWRPGDPLPWLDYKPPPLEG